MPNKGVYEFSFIAKKYEMHFHVMNDLEIYKAYIFGIGDRPF